MSYTPTIVIHHVSLLAKKAKLEEIAAGGYCEEDEQAAKFLLDALKGLPTIIRRVGIIIAQPEFSQPNEDVRNLLTELGVEYGISN